MNYASDVYNYTESQVLDIYVNFHLDRPFALLYVKYPQSIVAGLV